jgi:hypothetical protein
MNEMKILVPVDCDIEDEAKICKLDDVKCWALFDFKDGKFGETKFFDTREEIGEWVDAVIVRDQNEYVWPFIEENIAVLVASTQRYLEDIQEAFLFKELHDMNV